MDIVDAKLQRNELMLKQQKQEHYKNNLQALLKKLKEEEKLLVKVLNTLNVVLVRVVFYCSFPVRCAIVLDPI